MSGSLEVIGRRAEELLGSAGDALPRAAQELPAFARLLRAEPRLRAALTDIAVGSEGKRALLRSLLGERVDPRTLELAGLLVDESLSSEELERTAADLSVRAVMAAAESEGALEDVEDELFRFARVIDAQPDLRAALTNPALPADAKEALVRDLLEDRARPATVALVEFALESRVEGDPAELLAKLADMAASRRGRVVVEARTAVPLDVQRQARLSDALSRAVGRQVDLEVVLDPTVVGGVVARIGDELIDGSVRRKLELALEELTT